MSQSHWSKFIIVVEQEAQVPYRVDANPAFIFRRLPELSVEPVTEFLDRERQKEVHARRVAAEERARQDREREEQQKAAAAAAPPPSKHHYQVHGFQQHHHGASSSSTATNSAGSSAGNKQWKGKGGHPPSTESSRFKIVKPTRPAGSGTVVQPPSSIPNPSGTVIQPSSSTSASSSSNNNSNTNNNNNSNPSSQRS